MGILIEKFPKIIDRTKIEGESIDIFDENQEKELMGLDFVKSLYNLI